MAGPTDDFHDVDEYIAGELNNEAKFIFDEPAEMNHGLAQIYHNDSAPTAATREGGGVAAAGYHNDGRSFHRRPKRQKAQIKARIKAHADKTKDMTMKNGIMAFTTFYDENRKKLTPMPRGKSFEYGHKGISSLTGLTFRLKKMTAKRPDCTLTPIFSVPLAPNSVFFMPLSTNRWYTHEICPSALDTSMLSTRLGYVFRCSNTNAVYDPKDGNTYIKEEGGVLKKLEAPTKEDMDGLWGLYGEENLSDGFIDYGKKYFSMNKGDYLPPRMAAD